MKDIIDLLIRAAVRSVIPLCRAGYTKSWASKSRRCPSEETRSAVRRMRKWRLLLSLWLI